MQEAYLRAYKFFDGFHGENGRAWLLGIVRNTFYTWYQQNKAARHSEEFAEETHGAPIETVTQHSDDNPENLLLQKDSQRQLQQALAALPLEFREVMVLRELEELSYQQIAVIVGIPMGTVMSRLGRGRRRLAELLAIQNGAQDGT